MTNCKRHIGIDLSKRSMQVAIMSNKNNKILQKKFTTDLKGCQQFLRILKKDDIIGMETGNLSFELAHNIIKSIGCKVNVLNAGDLQIIFRSLKKTDKEDAIKICKLINRIPEEELPLVNIPSEEEMMMRTSVGELQRLKSSRTRCLNTLHNLLWNSGYVEATRNDMKNPQKRTEILKELKTRYKPQADRLIKQIELLEEQISEVEQEQHEIMKSKIDLFELTMSVPGVGPRVAFAIHAYMGDLSRFSNRKQVSYFTGFVPRIDNSGNQEHSGHIVNKGPNQLKGLMVQAAWSALRCKEENAFKQFYEQIKVRRGKRIAIVAVARKMIEIIFTLHKNQELFKAKNNNEKELTHTKLKKYKLVEIK